MPKIMHFIGALSGGGAETQLRLFTENAGSKKNNWVVSLNKSKPYLENTIFTNTDSLFGKWKQIYRILKTNEPKVVHIWVPAVLVYFLPPTLWYAKAKIFVGVRSVYQLDSLKRLLHLFLYGLSPNLIGNTHIEDQRGIFKMVFKQKKYYYVPNGLQQSVGVRKRINIKGKKLLFVGRLIEDKNILTLLEAMKTLSQHGFFLNIYGIGNQKQALVDYVMASRLENSVFFNDYQSDMESVYREHDILVLPSLREGMPNVLFESLSYGLIPVVSDIPVHQRWLNKGDVSLIFKRSCPTCLVNQVLSIHSWNENRIQSCTNFVENLLKELSVESYVKKIQLVYES